MGVRLTTNAFRRQGDPCCAGRGRQSLSRSRAQIQLLLVYWVQGQHELIAVTVLQCAVPKETLRSVH